MSEEKACHLVNTENTVNKTTKCLIADEMGLGKTLQALCVAYYYRAEWPLLIVVPSSLRYPWIEELERWLPEIHPHSINLIQNGGDISEIPRASVTIVTYGLLRHPASRLVQEALLNQHFEIIIVDESHYIKNRKTVSSKFLVPLLQCAKHKLLLTGTPALARPEELDSLCPGDFGTWTEFALRYCDAKWQYFGRHRRKWSTAGACNLEELQMMMAGKVMIRRLKKNVLSQLPPKQRQRIAFELKDSQLKKELDSTWEDLQVALGRKQLTIASLLSARETLQQEQMSSNDIYYLLGEIRKRTCMAKIGPVKDYIKMLCENAGLKLIVFAHFHIMMDSLSDLLHDLTIKFIRIDGHTPQQDRPRLVHQFQTDPSTRVAVLSMRAAGVGLTLTAAKLVVFAELDWTPGTLEQCEDRAHRIGQHDTVHVHYLVAKGTLDEWVWAALARKTTVVTTTLNGETQVLRMDDADAAQIECLTNANPFTPKDNSVADVDLSSFFQASQTPQGQKSVLDYFTSSRKRKMDSTSDVIKSHRNVSGKKSRKTCMENSRQNRDSSIIVLVDSDNDEHSDFKPSKMEHRMPKCEQTADGIGNFDLWSSDEENNDAGKNDTDGVRDKKEEKRLTDWGEEQTWSCKLCTFLNYGELPVCEMCNSPKVKKSTSVKPVTKSSGKAKQCRVSLGMVASEADRNLKDAGEKDTQCDNSVSCKHGNGDAMGNSLSAASSPVVTSTNGNSVGVQSQKGSCIVETCNQGKLVGSKAGHATESHSLQMTDLSGSDSDVDASEDRFDACCRLLTDESQTSKNEENRAESHDAPEMEKVAMNPVLAANDDVSKDKRGDHLKAEGNRTTGRCNEDTGDWEISVSEDCGSGADEKLQQAADTRVVHIDSIVTHTAFYYCCSKNTSRIFLYDQVSAIFLYDHESTIFIYNHGSTIFIYNHVSTIFHYDHVSTIFLYGHVSTIFLYDHVSTIFIYDHISTIFIYNHVSTIFLYATLSTIFLYATLSIIFIYNHVSTVFIYDYVNTIFIYDHISTIFIYNHVSTIFLYDHVSIIFPYDTLSIILIYNYAKEPLNVNFFPLDVEMSNYGELPDLLLHPANLRPVRRYLRQWNSLALNKRRVIVKSGEIFLNPCLLYEELKSGRTASKQRYTTKAEVAAMTLSKASKVGGSVRVISRSMAVTSIVRKKHQSPGPAKSVQGKTKQAWPDDSDILSALTKMTRNKGQRSSDESVIDRMKGILQAVDAEGRPLCVNCQQPYQNELVGFHVMQENPWQTRFCCRDCMQQYWMKTSRQYSVQQVFEAEHGVCQLCQVDAHEFFLRVKNCSSLAKRAQLIQESCYKVLKKDVKDRMLKQPQKGLFWNVDHITPVADGGGECDIDNLRTLCTVCHRDVTTQQNKERAKRKQRHLAAKCGDITAFFPVQ
ncbi:DNA annealing helicase and endonuclease ZRANB3 [Lamellibrachia satsuma]|nr:DNA annealing helicase and endonuclease ZRANB3 [Lamellibrachia satsuma]